MGDKVRINVLGRLFEGLAPSSVDGRYEFVYGTGYDAYDWLVVFDELPVDVVDVRCPKARTILCTWEPVSIKSYSRVYTRQFGHLLTNRPADAERHPRYHLGRGYFPNFAHNVPEVGGAGGKTQTISAVCSSKRMRHTLHQARFRLVDELSRAIPGFSWYGHGVRPLAHKEDALLPYRYHIAVENYIGPHHWTEKFSDAILCECLPFYAGDPLLAEVFPKESFIPIPIDDPSEAVRIVREAIAADEYARRRGAVLEAKRLILEKYNFWRQVVGVIETSGADLTADASDAPAGCLYARKALRKRDPRAALEDALDHVRRYFRIGRGRFG